MKKYLVKQVSIATKENLNFAGEVAISYYGKDEKQIGYGGSHYYPGENEPSRYMIEQYGYNRRCDAIRNWIYRHPENTKYWKSTVEIICVEL